MKSRAFALLLLAAGIPVSAQMRVLLEAPSAPGARLGSFPILPGLGASFGAMPLLAPSALTPALAALPSAPSVFAAAFVPAALTVRPAASVHAPLAAKPSAE